VWLCRLLAGRGIFMSSHPLAAVAGRCKYKHRVVLILGLPPALPPHIRVQQVCVGPIGFGAARTQGCRHRGRRDSPAAAVYLSCSHTHVWLISSALSCQRSPPPSLLRQTGVSCVCVCVCLASVQVRICLPACLPACGMLSVSILFVWLVGRLSSCVSSAVSSLPVVCVCVAPSCVMCVSLA